MIKRRVPIHPFNEVYLERYSAWANGYDSLLHKVEALEREMHMRLYLDTVGKPDFALWTAGARIIHPLTSQTYKPHVPFFRAPWARQSIVELRPPELVIRPENQPGQCWTMRGSDGSLGIRLAKEIEPRAVSIDHIPKPLTFDPRTAPKDIQVWGILSGKNSRMNHDRLHISTGLDLSYETRLPFHPEYYFTDFIWLGNVTYDVHSTHSTQTFNLSESMGDMKTDRILFLFQNNWGNDQYTCVYRIRVHTTT
ncbi:hypothetical protein LXA43DRAFT_903886 [Ganoderma leucocontextum]|nr:hypothetical protein LXA43DRAFT_903884 [Ganoderma leucocontextum]KAI1783278.1 hypothetical protein LXA43DRAFT_903886 [Ganoderma leucocontextum]